MEGLVEGKVVVVTGAGSGVAPESWRDLPGVQAATAEGAVHRLSVTEPHLTLPALMKRLEAGGAQLAALTTRHATLEDVFVELTGRHLDEAEPAGPVGKEVPV